MSHEVETMAYAGETPWHGLGVRVENPADAVSPQRFLELAGLDWRVDKIPVYAGFGSAPEDMEYEQTSHFATVRATDSKILGVVGPGYTVLQNKDAFEWFQPFLESGRVSFEAGGSLRGGAVIWAQARIVGLEDLVREDDRVVNYILLSHGHDGMTGLVLGFTPTRTVCMNTLSAAKANEESQLLRLRHTSGLSISMEKVRDIMDLVEKEFRASMTQYQLLANTVVNEKDIRKYVKIVIGASEMEEEISKATEKKIDRMIELAYAGRGNRGESLWDAYNGVNEYLGYEAGRSQDSRIRSLWFGDNKKMNDRALEVGVNMALAAA